MYSIFSKALQTTAVQSEPRGDRDLINGLQLTKLKKSLLSKTAQCQILQRETGSGKNTASPLYSNK